MFLTCKTKKNIGEYVRNVITSLHLILVILYR